MSLGEDLLDAADDGGLFAGEVSLFKRIGRQIKKLKRLAGFLVSLPLAKANRLGEGLAALVKLPVEIVVFWLLWGTP